MLDREHKVVLAPESFEGLAEAIVSRLTAVLDARVVVTDRRGRVVVGREPRAAERAADGSRLVRASVGLDGWQGAVIVHQPPDHEPVSARVLQGLVDLVVEQASVVAHLPNNRELKNKLISDLLRGPRPDDAVILRQAEILGMDLSRPRSVILVDASDFILDPERPPRGTAEARTQRQAQRVIDSIVSFFHLPDDTICAYIGAGEVAVLKASSTQDLSAWADAGQAAPTSSSWANLDALKRAGAGLLTSLRRDTPGPVNVGIGRYHPGIGGLARSYADARAALSLGRRVHGDNRVHCLDGVGVVAFVGLADEDTKAGLAGHLLSPLDHAPVLLHTLERFFANDCAPSPTADFLAIHRNTLTYRLDRVAALTGLDPRRFDDAVQIRLALAVRSLHQAEPASGADQPRQALSRR